MRRGTTSITRINIEKKIIFVAPSGMLGEVYDLRDRDGAFE